MRQSNDGLTPNALKPFTAVGNERLPEILPVQFVDTMRYKSVATAAWPAVSRLWHVVVALGLQQRLLKVWAIVLTCGTAAFSVSCGSQVSRLRTCAACIGTAVAASKRSARGKWDIYPGDVCASKTTCLAMFASQSI